MMNSKFNAIVAALVEKEISNGSTLEQAILNLAVALKASLMESGLYEELRERAKTIAAAQVPVVASKRLIDRNQAIAEIKAALKARGLRYSVTGGRGTAWGWISVDLMPAQFKALTQDEVKEARRAMYAAFGLTGCGSDISIPSSSDYYREYVDRANGRKPSEVGKPYWD